jgi:type IV pilus assembly protein PilV
MTSQRQRARARSAPQRGSFMLESLIAILIVALGVLGMVGLYARSIQNVDDSKFRGEAALLASTLVGQMWVSDPQFSSLNAKFDSGVGGPGFVEFAALVAQRFPNSIPPVVTVSLGATPTSSDVLITMNWRRPGDTTNRTYVMNATIGSNLP